MATRRSPNAGWKKSSASQQGGCVEVRFAGHDEVLVRDSKHPRGSVLQFSSHEWQAFLTGVRQGEFDHRG